MQSELPSAFTAPASITSAALRAVYESLIQDVPNNARIIAQGVYVTNRRNIESGHIDTKKTVEYSPIYDLESPGEIEFLEVRITTVDKRVLKVVKTEDILKRANLPASTLQPQPELPADANTSAISKSPSVPTSTTPSDDAHSDSYDADRDTDDGTDGEHRDNARSDAGGDFSGDNHRRGTHVKCRIGLNSTSGDADNERGDGDAHSENSSNVNNCEAGDNMDDEHRGDADGKHRVDGDDAAGNNTERRDKVDDNNHAEQSSDSSGIICLCPRTHKASCGIEQKRVLTFFRKESDRMEAQAAAASPTPSLASLTYPPSPSSPLPFNTAVTPPKRINYGALASPFSPLPPLTSSPVLAPASSSPSLPATDLIGIALNSNKGFTQHKEFSTPGPSHSPTTSRAKVVPRADLSRWIAKRGSSSKRPLLGMPTSRRAVSKRPVIELTDSESDEATPNVAEQASIKKRKV